MVIYDIYVIEDILFEREHVSHNLDIMADLRFGVIPI